jgi:tRNA (guanine37-N1)-methyltransferase
MQFTVITLFPDMLKAVTDFGVIGRACQQQLISVTAVNPRDFAEDKHKTVDDRPYGGGPGMVMMIAPLQKAIHQAKLAVKSPSKVIYLSPQGKPLTQAKAKQLSQESSLILLAGRYEGIDQRLLDSEVDEELSIGDFIVSGGELPAMLLIDAVARCLPRVLGHSESAENDSFSDGLLDCPHYTRPELDPLGQVPEVLLSGNHEAIRCWRLQQSLGQTWLKRPDLLLDKTLSKEEAQLLAAFKQAFIE